MQAVPGGAIDDLERERFWHHWQSLKARVPEVSDAGLANDLFDLLLMVEKLPNVSSRAKAAEGLIEAARKAYFEEGPAAACPALGLSAAQLRVERDRSLLGDFVAELSGWQGEPDPKAQKAATPAEAIARIYRRHGFNSEDACAKHLERMRTAIDKALDADPDMPWANWLRMDRERLEVVRPHRRESSATRDRVPARTKPRQ